MYHGRAAERTNGETLQTSSEVNLREALELHHDPLLAFVELHLTDVCMSDGAGDIPDINLKYETIQR